MPTTISPAVFDLAKELIDWPIGISIGCFTGNNCVNEIVRASETAKVSAACSRKAIVNLLDYEQNVNITAMAEPTITKPVDLFHVSFCYPSFGYKPARIIDGTPVKAKATAVTANDLLAQYMATRFNDGSSCSKHLLEVEQMLHSVMAGCYAFAVLPDWYMSGDMRYNRWMNANCSLVAKIQLPDSAVKMRYTRIKTFRANVLGGPIKWRQAVTTDVVVPGTKWSLVVWFKGVPPDGTVDRKDGKSTVGGFDLPKTGNRGDELYWAALSYSPFTAKLDAFDDGPVSAITRAFHESDWNRLSLFQWKKLIAEAGYSSPYKSQSTPRLIRADTNMIVVRTPQAAESRYRIVNSVNDIPHEHHGTAVLLKPTRSGLKLCGAFPAGNGVVCRVQDSYGYDENKDGTAVAPKMKIELRRDFDTIRADVLNRIEAAGGVSYMLLKEVRPLTRRRRRINRQLAAIPRMTPNLGAATTAATGKFSDTSDSVAIEDWSPVFAEIGVEKLFPEEYAEWSRRAKRSGVDSRFNYKYQVDDIIQCAMKARVVNGSVMGLGKTREMVQAALLRGSERMLIVVPSRLVGTWSDEIELEIEQFYKYRKNWNGKRYTSMKPNIIELAADCLPGKLKLFNIISNDRLKLTPRDAVFYKCSACGTVVCSFYEQENPLCPGEPTLFNVDPDKDMSCVGPYRRWKANTKRVDPDTGKRMYRKYKVDPVTAKEVHWDADHPSRMGLPDDHCEIIDSRNENPLGSLFGGPPDRPIMQRQEKMYSKTHNELVGLNTVKVKDKKTGEETSVEVPLYRRRIRKSNGKQFHVGWTFSDLLRNRFTTILWDEIMAMQDSRSLRSMAAGHLTATTMIGATGTPMRGMPQKIVAYINLIASREAYPDYREYDRNGLSNFLSRYKTNVVVGGKSKQIAKISNTERFLTEFSSVLLRRVRREPGVRPFLPDITVTFKDFAVEMDPSHKAYYQLFIDLFVEWYEAVLKEREERGDDSGGSADNVLAKLTYMRGAAVCPHGVLKSLIENVKKNNREGKADDTLAKWAAIIPPYHGPPPATTIRILTALKDAQMKGDKAIAFSCRQAALDLGKRCCDKLSVPTVVIDGRTSPAIQKTTGRSPRHLAVQQFRTDSSVAIWAGLGCLSEGMNIPEANHVLFNDLPWEPNDILQGTYRVVRPQQTKQVTSTIYYLAGSVSEFMFRLCLLKYRAHAEGVDSRSFSDIATSDIPTFSDYAESLVEDGGKSLNDKMRLAISDYNDEWEASAKSHLDDDDDDDDDEENGNGNGNGS